ncbi:MAG: hypothetical protein M1818_008450 [Claussenomyces sp. TS43310]|nr:MAG: hypothetical protein M1818_008450 [Claussenomyces sp. TS43310]
MDWRKHKPNLAKPKAEFMGTFCSISADRAGHEPEEAASQKVRPVFMSKMPPTWITEKITRQKMREMVETSALTNAQTYHERRDALILEERSCAFDASAQQNATSLEKEAARIVKAIRADDVVKVYATEKDSHGNHRSVADHFIGNVEIINKTELIKVAKQLPKGAHLHCHYNSCLPPKFLIEHARSVEMMWIKSTESLSTDAGRKRAEIQFQVQEPPSLLVPAQVEGDLLAADYVSGAWMNYQNFQKAFGGTGAAEKWLESKMLLTEDEVYGVDQNVKDIWLRFDICTRMMKGLFSYESAFRSYTRACIQDFMKDKILYAEVRPNFPSNVLRKDTGIGTLGNAEMMEIIIEEVDCHQKEARRAGQYFGGMKVIYCCPRVFKAEQIKTSMEECIALKKRFPQLICGYDLVGSEDRGHPLKFFIDEFIWFREECRRQNLSIPFLFHAGETLQSGTEVDENLVDAVLLGSKRIGHGFALPKHPLLLDMVKKQGICLESCPISNEVLHLCSTIQGHSLPELLARGVHCTVNSDNGTFYSSTLSHDFYQTMIGSEYMDIIGWKVLCQWSLEHSCMEPAERVKAERVWKKDWDAFCNWVVDTYGSTYPAL